jgi:hypothetical protein
MLNNILKVCGGASEIHTAEFQKPRAKDPTPH